MLVILLSCIGINIASAQSTFTSSSFSSSTSNYFKDDILNCYNTQSCNIYCSGSSTCYNAEINCPDNYDCNLVCSGSTSCYYVDLRCPKGTGACKVTCSGSSSCYYSNFNWTVGNTNTLSCSGSYCRYITYPPVPDTTSYTKTCGSTSYQCYYSTIVCPDNGNCNIQCTGSYGCQGANIICPKESGDCSITCTGGYSCRYASIQCPAGDGACSVSCTGGESCVNTEINWTNYSLSTLSCNQAADDCRGINYPQPDSDEPYTLECNIGNECLGSTILCPDAQTCNIFCTGTTSCHGATVHCPSTHNCNLFADGSGSFEDGVIYCPESAMCNVYCIGADGCEDAVALWAPDHFYANLGCPDEASDAEQCNILRNPLTFNPPNNDTIYNFVCDEAKECASSVINCPTDGDCIIDCHGYGSCAATTVNCPIDGNCYIYCLYNYACYYARIIAPVNGVLDVRCSTQSAFTKSCDGIETIYPSAFPTQIPTTAAPYTYSPTPQPTKSTLQIGIEDIQETQKDIIEAIEGLEAILAGATLNITLAELKDRLDYLRARVQLSPTRAPSYSPTAYPSNDPTVEPTMRPSQGPTTPSIDPTAAPSPLTTWIVGLTLGGNDNSYDGESAIDIGNQGFNGVFQNSYHHIIRRECGSCDILYQDLYYKRILNPTQFDAYEYMKGSTVINDQIFVDFMIYTSIDTALSNDLNGAWFGCNAPPRTSAFGDCYRTPIEFVKCQYPLNAEVDEFNASDPCNQPARYSIFVGDSSDDQSTSD